MSGAGRRRLRAAFMVVAVVMLGVALVFGRSLCILGRAALADRDDGRALPRPDQLDDASRQQRTRVAEVITLPADPATAADTVAATLARARDAQIPVSIAGARHSMGGHSLVEGGFVIDTTPLSWIEVDEAALRARVGAGTTWDALLEELDARDLSVAIMQSNDSFTVGGSVSVNCHGWQTGRPPIASSVRSLTVMTADGVVHHSSRNEDPELFSLVLGGYGLVGVVLDVELELVPNVRYDATRFVIPTTEYPDAFAREVEGDARTQMAFGRLSIVRGEDFLDEAILTVFRPAADQSDLPAMSSAALARTRRLIFRASATSDEGKRLRWQTERGLGAMLASRAVTRNSLLSEGVEVYENRSASTVDILHEYFVPHEAFVPFVERLDAIVTEHGGNLLNVTVRDVEADPDAFLRYADGDMFALVLLFEQPLSDAGDAAMQAMTRALIDAALELGGRFYLPYRLHATDDQLRRAYPRFDDFIEQKRALDPDASFRNTLYNRYVRR